MKTIERIIKDEILTLANEFVTHLSGNLDYIDQIIDVRQKADLSELPDGFTVNSVNGEVELYQDGEEFVDSYASESEAIAGAWDISDDEPPVIEALQHWIVSELPDGFTVNVVNGEVELYQDGEEFIDSYASESEAIADAWDISDDEPPVIEALQHWIVSDWLADKLEQVGAMVAKDVLGFNIWGRADCGQSLELNSDLNDVVKLLESDFQTVAELLESD